MTTFKIDLPQERAKQLKELAEKYGVSAEDLLRASVEDLLTQPEDGFRRAARYVLQKNTELYRRLS